MGSPACNGKEIARDRNGLLEGVEQSSGFVPFPRHKVFCSSSQTTSNHR